MVPYSKSVLPIILGISLCSASAVLLYILLRKEDDDAIPDNNDTQVGKFIKREKAIPKKISSAVIGRGGSKIKEIEQKSGARLNLSDDVINGETRICFIRGSEVSIEIAENLIDEIIEEQNSLTETKITVPPDSIGMIIGRKGDNINNMSRASGAKISINSQEADDSSSQKYITIKGSKMQIEVATDLILKSVEEHKKKRESQKKSREPRGKYAPSANSDKDVSLTNSNDPGTMRSSPKNAPPAGTSGAILQVFVTAVSSPSRFWLQIVGPQVDELDELIAFMTTYYNNAENRELHKLNDVQVGQIVAAVFRHDSRWYRGRVVQIKPNEFDARQEVCDVHFVDFGDNEFVAKDELMSLRTDMLKLRFQAVECFLAGVAPAPLRSRNDNDDNENDASKVSVVPTKWTNAAIQRFEDLTAVARWESLWSRTCSFKERPKPPIVESKGEESLPRNTREGSPIPGVKLYDTKGGKDLDIGLVLVEENYAIEVDDQAVVTPAIVPTPPLPTTPLSPTPLPPSFGDLECSRVLGMVIGNREERSASLPHGGSSPSSSPKPSPNLNRSPINTSLIDDAKSKSLSLAAGMDHSPNNKSLPTTPTAKLSYPIPNELNHDKHHQNGDFLSAERGSVSQPKEPHHDAKHPFHVPDPEDELKARINRVDSHHGNLETMGKQIPSHGVIHPQQMH